MLRQKNRLKNGKVSDAKGIQIAKDVVGLIKDVLEIVWKTAPLALLPAGLMIWSYLRTIQWVDLFGESAVSGAGFVLLVLTAIVMAFFVIVVFLVPSIFMIGVSHIFNSNSKLPKGTVGLYLWALGGWSIALFINLVFELPAWFYLISPMIIAFAAGVWQMRRNITIDEWATFGKPIALVLGNAFGASFSMAGTVFPLMFSLKYVSGVSVYSNDYPYISLVVCFLISTVGLVPGFMYVRSREVHEIGSKPFKIAAYGTIFTSYLVMTLVFAFYPISSTLLEATGVYSNEEANFQVLKDNLPGALKKAGFSVVTEDKVSTVKGFVRFNFGGIRLLCKAPFEPKNASPEARRIAAKDKKPDPALGAGAQCVPTQSSELRKFTI